MLRIMANEMNAGADSASEISCVIQNVLPNSATSNNSTILTSTKDVSDKM
jgi:hypothetical protein